MDKIWKKTFYLHSKTEEYIEKVENSINKIKQSYAKNPLVLFSGGKDSSVVLHLALQIYPNINVFHYDYGSAVMPVEIEKQIIENLKKIGAKNIIIVVCPQWENLRNKTKDSHFFIEISKIIKEKKIDTVFGALRNEEASKRKSIIKSGKNFCGAKNINIISEWSWMDVWAYIVSNEIPYLDIYDKYSKIHGWDKVRFVTFFDAEFDKFGNSNVDGVLMWKFKNIQNELA